MKVLIISLDVDLFRPDSETLQRHLEYTELIGELHILVLAQGSDKKITEKLQLYSITGQNIFFKLLNAFKKAEKIVRDRKIELIISQDPFFTGLVAWQVKRKFKIPLQIQIHTDFLSPYFWQESFLNKMRVLLAKFLLPKADCTRVVSKRIRDSLTDFKLKEEPVVLPIFVDAAKIKETPVKENLHQKYPQFDFIILMASRLTKEKNIDLAIEAMAEIVKQRPKTGLIVVGDGPEKNNLKLKIENLKLVRNVIIEPWTNDLVSYYKTADLFLLTSNYEGFGRVLVEAAVAGCNIVSTDVGISRELLDDNSIFKAGDKKELQEKILKAINKELKSAGGQEIKTKQEYLNDYKKALEDCL